MRILVFSELFYPHGGGAELATWLYTKMLSESGDVNLTIVTRQFPGEPQTERINRNLIIYRVPFSTVGGRYDTLVNVGRVLSNAIIKRLKESDVVYVPGGWYSVIPIAKTYKKPVVVHLHNYFIACPTSLMYDFANKEIKPSSMRGFMIHEWMEKRRKTPQVILSAFLNETVGDFCRRLSVLADAIIFVSKTQRDLVLSKIPMIKEKSYTIYNPIPNRPLVEAEKKGIGYFGGRSFVKGFNILMKALIIHKYKYIIEVYLTKVSDHPKKFQLRNGVCLNLLPKVEDIQLVMKKLAIVIIPSIWPEPAPYALIESMLCGKVIIATAVGGIPEIVNGAHPGVNLIKPLNYNEIADAINLFTELSLEKLNELGIKNREHVLRKFDNKRTIKSFINILEKV